MKTKLKILFLSLITMVFVTFILISCKKDSSTNSTNSDTTLKDFDGNVYTTVTIGKQTWMVENLRTTHYNDGTPIPPVSDSLAWINSSTKDAYCWYNNKASNGAEYGALYNAYVVNNTIHQLCPNGWHIPTTAEWDTLASYLGGTSTAGMALKESGTVHWANGNTGTNSSGFTALPGGVRHGSPSYYTPGKFDWLGQEGCWWSSTVGSPTQSSGWLYYNNTSASILGASLNCGISVRCIKNSN